MNDDHIQREQRNKKLQRYFKSSFIYLDAVSARLRRGDLGKDDAQEFFATQCNKPIQAIDNLFHIDNLGLLMKSFKNHTISIMRKENAQKNINAESISDNENQIGSIPFNDRISIEQEKERYRKIVKQRFDKESYSIVFNLILEGYTNQEIMEITNIKSVGTIRYRIKIYLESIK